MNPIETLQPNDPTTASRSETLLNEHLQTLYKDADRMFAGIMTAQWLLGIVFALWVSPRTWEGMSSQIHIHVYAAIFIGGLITSFPVFLALRRPGWVCTRHAIAVGQMTTSALLIHLTGGRIETHFHVFGSLAILSFYRDWRVMISATQISRMSPPRNIARRRSPSVTSPTRR